MAVKVYDTISPASDSFPALMAEHVNLVREDGTTDSIQNLYNNKELGAGGDTSLTVTESEFLALPEEEKLNNSYYLYDIGVHYKNGVAYSRKKPIQLTMAEYQALKEAGAIDEQQEYLIEANTEGILLGAEDIEYNNAESGIQATTVQGAIDKVNGNLGGLINDTKVTTTNTFSSDKIKAIVNEIIKFTLSKTDYQGIEAYPTECGVYRVVKKIDGIPNDSSQYATLIIYGNGYFTHIYHDVISGRMWIGYTADSVKAPTTWKELATMDKVVPQVIIENETTDNARTIIQNSWGAFPTNNSLAKIKTSIFTWSAQIYKHDSSWGTIILTCYADNKDSYIGKLSNKAWHWYKMGLTEV